MEVLKNALTATLEIIDKEVSKVKGEILEYKQELERSYALIRAKDQIINRQALDNKRLRDELEALKLRQIEFDNRVFIINNLNKMGAN